MPPPPTQPGPRIPRAHRSLHTRRLVELALDQLELQVQLLALRFQLCTPVRNVRRRCAMGASRISPLLQQACPAAKIEGLTESRSGPEQPALPSRMSAKANVSLRGHHRTPPGSGVTGFLSSAGITEARSALTFSETDGLSTLISPHNLLNTNDNFFWSSRTSDP